MRGVSRQGALWLMAAVLGLVFTAAITWATAQLTSQHIGLSSEPLSAAGGLAPPVARRTVTTRAPAAGRGGKTTSSSHGTTSSHGATSSRARRTSGATSGGATPATPSTPPATGEWTPSGEPAPSTSPSVARSAPRTTSTGVTPPRRGQRSSSDDGGGDGRESRSREAGGTPEGREPGRDD